MATYVILDAVLVLTALILGIGVGITLIIVTDARRPT